MKDDFEEKFIETEKDRLGNHQPFPTASSLIADLLLGFLCAITFAGIIYAGLQIVLSIMD
jgi:hypothetical protein